VRLLLDTQAFLWWMDASPKLSVRARRAIADPANEVCVSVASAWEIAIKRSLGKLRTPAGVGSALESEGFALLPIKLGHAEALESLPWHHRDPFDRMLIAQAKVEGVDLVSRDAEIALYEVNLLW
jgi:PIN domain nuclease of toxin-antitoxin system